MCIQFVYVNNSPGPGEYQLIVTNNRDEMHNRPTSPAAFWGPNDSYLSGLDQFPGREGGTWFGVSQAGKVAALLNILTPTEPLPDKLGRGHLVTEYLMHPTRAVTYLTQLKPDAECFNPFSLILIEKGDDGWRMHYYSNSKDFDNSSSVLMKDGVHGFSNSVIGRPFKKVVRGEEAVRRAVAQYGNIRDKACLHKALFEIMADTTSTLPDSQLSLQAGSALSGGEKEQRSGIYVGSSQIGYGTRTTTLLTVRADGHTEYIEKTMREPIDSLNPVWDTVSYEFHQRLLHAQL